MSCLFLDLGWLWVTETAESKTTDKGRLLTVVESTLASFTGVENKQFYTWVYDQQKYIHICTRDMYNKPHDNIGKN